MKQVKVITLSIFAVLLIVGIATAQSRSRQKAKSVRTTAVASSMSAPESDSPTPSNAKQSVSIKMKNGDLLIGTLLRRDSRTIQVDLTKGPRIIRLDEIETLTYLPKEKAANEKPATTAKPEAAASQPDPASEKIIATGRKAYAALRKLSAAAQVGLPYGQYGNYLVETKAMVDESLATLPEGAVKANLAAAMEAYADAGQAWSAGQAGGVLPIASEPGATLVKKYAIKPAVNALGQEDRLMLDVTLTAIWIAAKAQLESVEPLLKL